MNDDIDRHKSLSVFGKVDFRVDFALGLDVYFRMLYTVVVL